MGGKGSKLRWPDSKIHVLVPEAKGLPGTDISGRSDPYVIVKYGPQTKKGASQSITTNPYWPDTVCSFDPDDTVNDIMIYVYDSDVMKKDQLVGIVKVPLDDIAPGSTASGWFAITPSESAKKEVQKEEVQVGAKEEKKAEEKVERAEDTNQEEAKVEKEDEEKAEKSEEKKAKKHKKHAKEAEKKVETREEKKDEPAAAEKKRRKRGKEQRTEEKE